MDTLEQEGDAYSNSTVTNTGDDQIGTAKADQTQMVDLANAAKAFLIASAQGSLSLTGAALYNGWMCLPGPRSRQCRMKAAWKAGRHRQPREYQSTKS